MSGSSFAETSFIDVELSVLVIKASNGAAGENMSSVFQFHDGTNLLSAKQNRRGPRMRPLRKCLGSPGIPLCVFALGNIIREFARCHSGRASSRLTTISQTLRNFRHGCRYRYPHY